MIRGIMAFSVLNVVQATAEEVALIVADLQVAGLKAVSGHDGFRLARLCVSEDGTEGLLYMEWDTREQFLTYRQSEVGRALVDRAMQWHPKISFYEVITALDGPPR